VDRQRARERYVDRQREIYMWIDARTVTYIDKNTDIQTNRLYKWMNGFDRGETDRQTETNTDWLTL
jgi:hypothetical protein